MRKLASLGASYAMASAMAFAIAAIIALPSANAGTVSNPTTFKMVPTGKGWGVKVPQTEGAQTGPADAGTAFTGANGINYNAGPIMSGRPNVYYIFYGGWTDTSGVNIVTNFGQFLGGNPYFMVNSTYYDNTQGYNTYVTGALNFAGSIFDTNSQGVGVTNLSDTQILNIVTRAINTGGQGPADPNGIYLVLGNSNITEHDDANTSSLCNNYCGWHNHATINGADVKYGFIGNPAVCATVTTIDSCVGHANNEVASPNNDLGPDAMTSIIAHELSESVSDPDLNAWYEGDTAHENGDLCAYCFGSTCTPATSAATTKPVGNGSDYNVQVGTLRYLIQKMWLNARGGICSLSK